MDRLREMEVFVRRETYAVPSYLEARGEPDLPRKLTRHACVSFTGVTSPLEWVFAVKGAVAGEDSAAHDCGSRAFLEFATETLRENAHRRYADAPRGKKA